MGINEDQDARLTALESGLSSLSSRVAALENAPAVDTSELASRVAALENAPRGGGLGGVDVDALHRVLDPLEGVGGRVAELERRAGITAPPVVDAPKA